MEIIQPKSIVYLEDCIQGMKRYENKHFDLAIVDPPYGIGRSGHNGVIAKNPKHNWKAHTWKDWDNETPTAEYWAELFRVSKNQIVWGGNYFTEYLPPSMGWIFWDKGQDLTMSDGELAYTSFNRALRRIKINRGQLMVEGGTIHPTQKPIKLYDWIIQNYCADANLILDTHVGSGSSRIAAYKGGFDFVGFEIDAEYYEKQEKRFNDFKSQLRLTF
jgi:site-specific DNA-methyltransferase (adenine-specific)